MRIHRVLAAAALTCLLFTGSASAAYLSSQDSTLSVQLLPGTLQTTSATGDLTFSAQEGLHSTVTSLTGTSVDHYYVWVTVNGEPVLAVDPLGGMDLR